MPPFEEAHEGYIGWIYTCIIAGKKLTKQKDGTISRVFPFITSGLFFGMCGVYECQGPLMGWWLWPREDGIVKPSCNIWQFGIPGNNPHDFVTTDHVEEALGERIFGFPLLAPYFHCAFGWGIAMALQLTTSVNRNRRNPRDNVYSNVIPILSSVLLGPTLGMLWDPPIRIFKVLIGANKVATAPAVMAMVFLMPLIVGDQLTTDVCQGNRDLLLVIIPIIQHVYFVGNCLFGHGAHIIPSNLKLFICCIAIVSTSLHFKAIGYAKFVSLNKKSTNILNKSNTEDNSLCENPIYNQNDSSNKSRTRGRSTGLVSLPRRNSNCKSKSGSRGRKY